ncbi:alpha/beta hydrolase [Amycolatopsis anabasis]|uniref:alpha/beta hydrolase n=1 Tax=Amycolatopsis anabasis TaxID=1840409 RepID=UPI00131DD7CE|nr:alpha/beta fold hydrolase [Amycolatopsis anabasis]
MAITPAAVEFDSHGSPCAGLLYRPEGGGAAPVVVLGHGLGCVKEMRLTAYAERFAEAGFAALAFDYRFFGASGGEPRQLLDIGAQLEDWASALDFARSLDGVDTDRVAIWGSSFGGGHVLEAAARDGRVAAVVSQCPFTDGPASTLALGPRSAARVSIRALRDELARAVGRAPVRVGLAGPPGSAALMTAPDVVEGYFRLVPEGQPFTNEVAARVGLRIPLYRPGRRFRSLRCPVFVAVCDRDTVAPPRATLRAARRGRTTEVRRYPVGHFDIYVGAAFEQAVTDQIDFLRRHLLAR